MNTPRTLAPTAPARGSFPLDHEGACKSQKEEFLKCMKAQSNSHAGCRELSKVYLSCRMDNNLMAQEDLNTLGFHPDTKIVIGKDLAPQDEEVIAGLSTAKKSAGIIFGIGSNGRRGGGH